MLVTEQAARIAEQDAVIAALVAEVAELRSRLGMDSSNSSKPPASDGLDRTRRSTPGSGKRGKSRGATGSSGHAVWRYNTRLIRRAIGPKGRVGGALTAR